MDLSNRKRGEFLFERRKSGNIGRERRPRFSRIYSDESQLIFASSNPFIPFCSIFVLDFHKYFENILTYINDRDIIQFWYEEFVRNYKCIVPVTNIILKEGMFL